MERVDQKVLCTLRFAHVRHNISNHEQVRYSNLEGCKDAYAFLFFFPVRLSRKGFPFPPRDLPEGNHPSRDCQVVGVGLETYPYNSKLCDDADRRDDADPFFRVDLFRDVVEVDVDLVPAIVDVLDVDVGAQVP